MISVEQAKRNLRREIVNYDIDSLAVSGRNVWNKVLGKIEVKGSSEEDKAVFYTSLYRVYERPVNISEDGKYFRKKRKRKQQKQLKAEQEQMLSKSFWIRMKKSLIHWNY